LGPRDGSKETLKIKGVAEFVGCGIKSDKIVRKCLRVSGSEREEEEGTVKKAKGIKSEFTKNARQGLFLNRSRDACGWAMAMTRQ